MVARVRHTSSLYPSLLYLTNKREKWIKRLPQEIWKQFCHTSWYKLTGRRALLVRDLGLDSPVENLLERKDHSSLSWTHLWKTSLEEHSSSGALGYTDLLKTYWEKHSSSGALGYTHQWKTILEDHSSLRTLGYTYLRKTCLEEHIPSEALH